jgi:hypothetical protein
MLVLVRALVAVCVVEAVVSCAACGFRRPTCSLAEGLRLTVSHAKPAGDFDGMNSVV